MTGFLLTNSRMIIKMFELKDYATTELCNNIISIDVTDLLDKQVIQLNKQQLGLISTQQQRVM